MAPKIGPKRLRGFEKHIKLMFIFVNYFHKFMQTMCNCFNGYQDCPGVEENTSMTVKKNKIH